MNILALKWSGQIIKKRLVRDDIKISNMILRNIQFLICSSRYPYDVRKLLQT